VRVPWGSADELPDDVRERFRAQDVDALAAVYDRYHRQVWGAALRVIGNDALAQEAAQDAFVRAWQAAASYDAARPLGPWLLTIARRTALDLVRRELRPTRGGHEEEQDAVIEDPGIDQAWLCWEVQEALGRLTEDEREIVRLAFFEDLTQPQIAERLGVPVGTVKSRSHRAHRRLAELLRHVRDDPPEPVPVRSNREPPPRRTAGGRDTHDEGSERR
jgi:RNA polymerase sigma-70 factor (ECF subfamily)